MDNAIRCESAARQQNFLNKKEDDGHVTLTKEEIIDTLKTLEGVKRKLQAALKRS
jgi:hypothetical protein